MLYIIYIQQLYLLAPRYILLKCMRIIYSLLYIYRLELISERILKDECVGAPKATSPSSSSSTATARPAALMSPEMRDFSVRVHGILLYIRRTTYNSNTRITHTLSHPHLYCCTHVVGEIGARAQRSVNVWRIDNNVTNTSISIYYIYICVCVWAMTTIRYVITIHWHASR